MSTTAGGIVIPEEVDLSGIDTTHPDIQQFDLWLPGQDFFDEMSAVQLRLGLDTIDPSVLHGLQFFWLAGYIGGNWPDFHPLCLAYPVLARAGRIFSYAVTASEDADWLDCELGDASVPEADPWIQRQVARGHKKPGVYANLSRWMNEGLKDALTHWGSKITRGVAWYNGQANFNGIDWADYHQFTDHYGGRNLDGNVAKDSVFVPGPAPIQNSLHYNWFTGTYPTKRWGNVGEESTVEEYDVARKQPAKYKSYITGNLEPKLQWLADRIASMAIDQQPNKDGTPSWQLNKRGWRFQQLIHRSQGMQFAK